MTSNPSPAGRRFDFAIQAAVEAQVTPLFVEHIRSCLPAGWAVRVLDGKKAQKRGDIELSRDGATVTLELKIESYASTLFLETMQFVGRDSAVKYFPSWGFTTTASVIAYFSCRTGQLMFVPRRAWLETGLRLMELNLLTSMLPKAREIRPYVILNHEEDVLTGGAAGLAMRTLDWLTLFCQRGGNADGVVLTDGSGLLREIRRLVLADPLAAAMHSPRALVADQKAILEELVRWAGAQQPTPDEADALALLLRRLGDLRRRSAPSFDDSSQLSNLLTGVAPSLSRDPLHYSMWFLVEASLQHGRTNSFVRTEDLVRQAQSREFLLSEADLQRGTGAPAIPDWAWQSTLRLGRNYSAGYSQAPRGAVLQCSQMGEAETEGMRGMYLTCLQHPKPTAC